MADASPSSEQSPALTEQQSQSLIEELIAKTANLNVKPDIEASVDDPSPPALAKDSSPSSSRSIHARIAAEAASHAALCKTISSTQHAPPAVAEKTQQIDGMQAEWKARAKRLKDLEGKIHTLQNAKPRRFSMKLGSSKGSGSGSSSKPAERDKAYQELWQEERREKEQQEALERQLDAAYAARAALEPAAQQHMAAQQALYTLHSRVFATPTPELPDVFAAADKWYRAMGRAQDAAVARELERSVLEQLCGVWPLMVDVVESVRYASNVEQCKLAGLGGFQIQRVVQAAKARQPRVCDLGFIPMSPMHESSYVLIEGTMGSASHLETARWVFREMEKVKHRLKEEIVHARRRLAAAEEAAKKANDRFEKRRVELRLARMKVFEELDEGEGSREVEEPADLKEMPVDSKGSA